MAQRPYPAEVRELVRKAFQQLAKRIIEPSEIDECVLLDRQRIAARSYRFGPWLAMWLVGVGIVQLYDSQGNMLQTINLLEDQPALRLVA